MEKYLGTIQINCQSTVEPTTSIKRSRQNKTSVERQTACPMQNFGLKNWFHAIKICSKNVNFYAISIKSVLLKI